MSYLYTALAAAAIYLLFLPVVTFVVAFHRFAFSRWRIRQVQTIEDEAVSEAYRRLAGPFLENLLAKGWVVSHAISAAPMRVGDGPMEGMVLRRSGQPVRAMVAWQRGGNALPSVSFYTPLLGGPLMITTSGHPIQELVRSTEFGVHRILKHDPDEMERIHLERHEKAVQRGFVAQDLDREEFHSRLDASTNREVLTLIGEGRATAISPVEFRVRLGFAFRWALRFAYLRKRIAATQRPAGLGAAERAALLTGSRTLAPSTDPDAPPPPSRPKWKWTVGTLIAFAIAQGFWLGWSAVPVFLAVLVFHEAGHLVAMRIFGYRDVNVFFVPFLGALATADGKPWGIAPWKRALVSIAGPLPGIFLAVALWACVFAFHLPGWILWKGVLVLALLNLFNLLPLGDLDGGQFLQSVLFSRFPRAELVFRLAGTVGLAALGLWFEMPLLAAFAALPLLTLGTSYAAANLRRHLAKEFKISGRPNGPGQALVMLDRVLEHPDFTKLPLQRRALVKEIVSKDLDLLPMPWWQSFLLLLLYFVLWSPILIPLVGGVAMIATGHPVHHHYGHVPRSH